MGETSLIANPEFDYKQKVIDAYRDANDAFGEYENKKYYGLNEYSLGGWLHRFKVKVRVVYNFVRMKPNAKEKRYAILKKLDSCSLEELSVEDSFECLKKLGELIEELGYIKVEFKTDGDESGLVSG